MSQAMFKNHPSNPANQPFGLSGRKNLTKINSWWKVGSSSFWKTKNKKVKKDD